jgi:prepilin-type N-terminal cleavage/methylation domain-containing protein
MEGVGVKILDRLCAPWTSTAGLTLVEVLVAIVVLALTSMAMSATGITVIDVNAFSRRAAIATTLAQDHLEALKALPMTAPQLAAGTHQDPLNPLTGTGGSGGSYTRTWTVTHNTPAAQLRTLAVTVQWTVKGTPRSVVLTTVKVP